MPILIKASAAMALFLLFSSAASGESGQLFLNVYVDGTPGKALVVGNVDDITGLAFLNTSDKIYEDNGQLYAICDSLVKKDGDGWRLSFPAEGYYEEDHAVFFVSGGLPSRRSTAPRAWSFYPPPTTTQLCWMCRDLG